MFIPEAKDVKTKYRALKIYIKQYCHRLFEFRTRGTLRLLNLVAVLMAMAMAMAVIAMENSSRLRDNWALLMLQC